jgi:hypothetical protein
MIPINTLSNKMVDISGDVVGSLTAIKPLYKRNKNAAVTWEWLCSCGNTRNAEKAELIAATKCTNNPKIPSCGCEKIISAKETHTTHNMSNHPLFNAWIAMIERCYKQNSRSYRYYGAKGITVCKEWLDSFESFRDWSFSNGWVKGFCLDKDKLCKEQGIYPPVYSPTTCLWITKSENSALVGTRDNWKTNKNIKLSPEDVIRVKELRMQKMTLQKLSKLFNVSISTISKVCRGS